jgi:hypothetical protein
MAKLNGTGGVVKTGAVVIAELNNWGINDSVNKVTGRAFGEDVETAAAGARTITGTLKGFFAPGDSAGQALIVAGATLALELYPAGDTTGDNLYTISAALIDSVALDVQNDQYVSFDASFHANVVPVLSAVP